MWPWKKITPFRFQLIHSENDVITNLFGLGSSNKYHLIFHSWVYNQLKIRQKSWSISQCQYTVALIKLIGDQDFSWAPEFLQKGHDYSSIYVQSRISPSHRNLVQSYSNGRPGSWIPVKGLRGDPKRPEPSKLSSYKIYQLDKSVLSGEDWWRCKKKLEEFLSH